MHTAQEAYVYSLKARPLGKIGGYLNVNSRYGLADSVLGDR